MSSQIRHIRPAADHWKGLCESGKPALQVLDEKDAVRAAVVKADQWNVPGLARKDRRRGRAAEDAPKSTSVRMMCNHCRHIVHSEAALEHMVEKSV